MNEGDGGGGWRMKVWWRQEATKKNFGPPWKTRGKLNGGGGAVGRRACSRTATGRERNSGWAIGMLGRRQATPRWENDLVWQSEMLEQRQRMPLWADETVWWLRRRLGNLEGLGSKHKISDRV